ncbi:hypothetical protein N7462_000697 [Penicillium macrosclerotiorum]|uniref:uncharacterized protein n=1 Tax=Penicillium macrosclerotiorum TaxID=303699 RepID=UPI002549923F|nr:uncharacterized protein N7462_000697 [Penicillium macrosclerotiorum]KAJ5698692.1 hypothetical protein N7462_000697 [Penicillium macrosclerotiorum]
MYDQFAQGLFPFPSQSMLEMQNPSCLLYGPGDVRLEDRPLPAIEDPYDVIIRIAYVGVCGSDVHFWLHGGVKNFVAEDRPLVMGHEASGIVHAVGPAVTTLKPGDPIAIEPGSACRLCSRCKAGKYNLCPQMSFAANPPYTHGALTKYYKMPADCCYKIPTNLTKPFGLDEACLVEPLSVAVHAVRQVGVQPGDKVVVFGAGTIGLLSAAVAREFGASMVISVDISRDKLDFAHSFVPNGRVSFSTAIPNSALSAEENAQCLRGMHRDSQFTESDIPGFDVAIEATGAELCIQMAIHSLRVGGRFVQIGLGNRNVTFPISTVSENEITVKGCFRYGPGDYKMALELALTRKIELHSLITKIVPFEKVVDAWETTKRGEGIKTLIRGVGFTDGFDIEAPEYV